MTGENTKSFDLAALMRRGDMQVLKVARNSPRMTAEEYLILLSRFVDSAPAAEAAIQRIAEFSDSADDLKTLTSCKFLLMSVGHSASLADLNTLIDTVEQGNRRLASIFAQNFFDTFRGVYKRTIASANGSIADFWQHLSAEGREEAGDGTSIAERRPQTLIDALRLVTKNEARRKRRVLSVDDSLVMIKTVTSALDGEYTVKGLTDPARIEHTLLRFMPDLFLLDVIMPKLSGFDLIPVIRKFPEHVKTPIVILTGNGSGECLAAAVSLGVSDFMVKPITPKILREKVAKHMSSSQIIL